MQNCAILTSGLARHQPQRRPGGRVRRQGHERAALQRPDRPEEPLIEARQPASVEACRQHNGSGIGEAESQLAVAAVELLNGGAAIDTEPAPPRC
jgi:hypothetical protein